MSNIHEFNFFWRQVKRVHGIKSYAELGDILGVAVDYIHMAHRKDFVPYSWYVQANIRPLRSRIFYHRPQNRYQEIWNAICREFDVWQPQEVAFILDMDEEDLRRDKACGHIEGSFWFDGSLRVTEEFNKFFDYVGKKRGLSTPEELAKYLGVRFSHLVRVATGEKSLPNRWFRRVGLSPGQYPADKTGSKSVAKQDQSGEVPEQNPASTESSHEEETVAKNISQEKDTPSQQEGQSGEADETPETHVVDEEEGSSSAEESDQADEQVESTQGDVPALSDNTSEQPLSGSNETEQTASSADGDTSKEEGSSGGSPEVIIRRKSKSGGKPARKRTAGESTGKSDFDKSGSTGSDSGGSGSGPGEKAEVLGDQRGSYSVVKTWEGKPSSGPLTAQATEQAAEIAGESVITPTVQATEDSNNDAVDMTHPQELITPSQNEGRMVSISELKPSPEDEDSDYLAESDLIEDIRREYGEIVYDMIVNYHDHPELTMRDIAEFADVPLQHVRDWVIDLYGDTTKRKLKLSCVDTTNTQVQRLKEKYPELQGLALEWIWGKTFRIKHNQSILRVMERKVPAKNKWFYIQVPDNIVKPDFIFIASGNYRYVVPFVRTRQGENYRYLRSAEVKKYRDRFNLLTKKGPTPVVFEKDSKELPIGVQVKDSGKYEALVTVGDEIFSFGEYDTVREAGMAHDCAALALCPENVQVNGYSDEPYDEEELTFLVWACNPIARKHSLTYFDGVAKLWNERYHVQINDGGDIKVVGVFVSVPDAIAAYNTARAERGRPLCCFPVNEASREAYRKKIAEKSKNELAVPIIGGLTKGLLPQTEELLNGMKDFLLGILWCAGTKRVNAHHSVTDLLAFAAVNSESIHNLFAQYARTTGKTQAEKIKDKLSSRFNMGEIDNQISRDILPRLRALFRKGRIVDFNAVVEGSVPPS